MAAISKIKIDGFKAFPKEFELTLDGKNLLMYGENGSGKSSIYYALHALLQSQCKDKCSIYFSTTHPESIVNKYTNKPNAKVEIKFEGSDVAYSISQAGYNESVPQATSPLRDLNGKCVFINHKFLFNVFSFRNSQYIDLFPVFIKDILPFTLTRDKSKYISELYDEAVAKIKRKGRGNRIDDTYKDLIKKFNEETEYLIKLINQNAVPTATDIFNNNFRDIGDRKLKISLEYNDNRDDIPLPNKSYWLRLGYRYHPVEIAGRMGNKKLSTELEVLQPVITLKVEELQDDNVTYKPVPKPQTQFNEAKLTAIALSIRFALLNTVDPADGRFLALDDMLISLDMSNRAKVVDFLLKISDNYKIYLFTHDRAFFNYVCRKIQQRGKTDEWIYKRMSYNINNKEPLILDEYSDYLSKAKHFYEIGDYDTSAIYLRKQLEQDVGELLPYELKTKADGGFVDLQTLWNKLVKFYSDNGKSLEPSMQTLFTDSKLLILNVAAHFQRLSNPIYRIEVDNVFKLIDYVKSLEKISDKLIIEGGKRIIFQHPTIDYKCSFELDSDLVIVQEEHIVARIPKCKNIRWSYRGVDNWDFEQNAPNDMHQLLTSTPKLTKFFLNCCEKVPLNINCEMLMKHSFIEGEVSLAEYLGGVDILRISIKANL